MAETTNTTDAAEEIDAEGPWTVSVWQYAEEGDGPVGEKLVAARRSTLEAAVQNAKQMLDLYKKLIDGSAGIAVEVSPAGRVMDDDEDEPEATPDVTPPKPDPKTERHGTMPRLADFPHRDHGPRDPLRWLSKVRQAIEGNDPDGKAPFAYGMEIRDGKVVSYRKNRAD